MSTENKCPHCGSMDKLSKSFQKGYMSTQNELGQEIATLRQQLAEVTGERDGARLNLKGPCELCWTCSWAPCPPGTPHAVKDGENWIVCQCCQMKQQLADCRNQLVTAEAVEAGLRADVADLQQQLVDEKAKREAAEKLLAEERAVRGGIQRALDACEHKLSKQKDAPEGLDDMTQIANDLRARLETAEAGRDKWADRCSGYVSAEQTYGTHKELHADNATLRAEVERLKGYLERAGWGPCNIAACNCNGWHKLRMTRAENEAINEAVSDVFFTLKALDL